MNKLLRTNLKNTFFINTLFIIVTNFIVKLLGLVNKITMTRLLGTEGMSLYVLSFPTIMLFVSISGFSLNITISKLVSESLVNRKYSPDKILKKSCLISLILSFFLSLLYLAILKPVTIHLLKNENLYYPLLAGAPLLMLVGVSDGLKGYFSGIKKLNISSMGNLTEQIGRISFSLIFLFIMLPFGVEKAVFFCLLSLSFGELCAIIYCLIKLKKHPTIKYENTKGESKAILKMAVPNTLSRLIGNFTYFLEPIIYTTILVYLGFSVKEIQTTYTIFDAYTIPLLTFFSFIPFAIASAMIPGISESHALNKTESIHYYIRKSFLFCIIPVLILSINLFFFSYEYMNLIYGTSSGASFVRPLTFLFIFYYLQVLITAILQASGYSKKVFISSTIVNFLRLFFIIIFSISSNINLNSILIATTLAMIIGYISNYIMLKKLTHFKFKIKDLLTIIFILLIVTSITYLLKLLNVNFILILIINSTIFIILSIWQKLIQIESLKKKKS